MESRVDRRIRIGLWIGAGVLLVALFFADRKVLDTRNREVTNENSATEAGLNLAPYAETLARIKNLPDETMRQNTWDSLINTLPDPLLKLWMQAQSLAQSTDTFKLVEVQKAIRSLLPVSDSIVDQQLRESEEMLIAQQLRLAPSSLPLQISQALAWVEMEGKSMEGILQLRKLGDQNPEVVSIQVQLGKFALQTGQYAKAAERFGKILSKHPEEIEALIGMGKALAGQEKTEEAKTYWKKALENPDLTPIQEKEINQLLTL